MAHVRDQLDQGVPQRPRTLREAMLRVADDTAVVARHLGREDLGARTDELHRWLEQRTASVVVGGAYKQGKTSLVGAVLGDAYVLGDAERVTTVPTTYRFDLNGAVTVHFDDGTERSASLDELHKLTTTGADDDIGYDTRIGGVVAARISHVDVRHPASVLAAGLTLTDLPGIGALTSGGALEAIAWLHRPDIILYVSDAGAPLNAEELDFLERVGSSTSIVALVESRIDLHPRWRAVVEIDAAATVGCVVAVAGVTADLAARDPIESGVDDLRNWLVDTVARRVNPMRLSAVADDLLGVLGQLHHSLTAEAEALTATSSAKNVLADATERRTRLDASRWQTVLSDGLADLASEIDHDLRVRVKAAGQVTDEFIDSCDPTDHWPSITAVAHQQCNDLIVDHFRALDEQVRSLLTTVLEMVDTDMAELYGVVAQRCAAPNDIAAHVRADDTVFDRTGRAGTAMAVVRSAYGSSLLLGFVGAAAGVTIAAPVVLLAGAAIGSRGLRKEREKQLAGRRSQARQTVRRHFDETAFVLGKRSRDAVRQVQRCLRDDLAGRLRQLERTLDAEISAARNALQTDRRDDRVAEVERELVRVIALADVVRAVAAASQVPR